MHLENKFQKTVLGFARKPYNNNIYNIKWKFAVLSNQIYCSDFF